MSDYKSVSELYKEERLKRVKMREAVVLLFQREAKVSLTSTQRAQLFAYINQQFIVCNCCVLYGRSERFRKFLKSIELPETIFGKCEIIINSSYTILFSKDYTKRSPSLYL